MISHVLASMLLVLQADSVAQARQGYADCLDKTLRTELATRATPAAYDRAATTACAAKAAAFRNAVMQSETAAGASQAEAEELANMEVEDLGTNMKELYRVHHEDGTRPK